MPELIHHIAVVVSDVEKAKNFYSEVFGFEPIRRLTNTVSKHRGAWFKVGGLELHLQERREPTPKTEQHFALLTQRFEEVVDRVIKNGGKLQEAALIEGMKKRCFVFDLDENKIELLSKD